ncbi:MAG: hypothetical protein D6816_07890 [Bacteroidetes bacterium]|nr:MAG: hypothetical protein D6816_07890 [Bacteroidota bacterium]
MYGGGFETAFLGTFAGSALGAIGVKVKDQVFQTVKAAVIGGTVSEIGGGKFANGAAYAAFTYAVAANATSSKATDGVAEAEERSSDPIVEISEEMTEQEFREKMQQLGQATADMVDPGFSIPPRVDLDSVDTFMGVFTVNPGTQATAVTSGVVGDGAIGFLAAPGSGASAKVVLSVDQTSLSGRSHTKPIEFPLSAGKARIVQVRVPGRMSGVVPRTVTTRVGVLGNRGIGVFQHFSTVRSLMASDR